MSLGKYLAHFSDVVLQELLVEGVSNLQPTDKCEDDNFLPTIGDFGKLILEQI